MDGRPFMLKMWTRSSSCPWRSPTTVQRVPFWTLILCTFDSSFITATTSEMSRFAVLRSRSSPDLNRSIIAVTKSSVHSPRRHFPGVESVFTSCGTAPGRGRVSSGGPPAPPAFPWPCFCLFISSSKCGPELVVTMLWTRSTEESSVVAADFSLEFFWASSIFFLVRDSFSALIHSFRMSFTLKSVWPRFSVGGFGSPTRNSLLFSSPPVPVRCCFIAINFNLNSSLASTLLFRVMTISRSSRRSNCRVTLISSFRLNRERAIAPRKSFWIFLAAKPLYLASDIVGRRSCCRLFGFPNGATSSSPAQHLAPMVANARGASRAPGESGDGGRWGWWWWW
mmetsp:Transcript_32007/g.77964  ORF Transcript_32007/g.77964 Transcript_32007/m.77964 type:complete len:338 (-) Transcript_32007:51-1064(-)